MAIQLLPLGYFLIKSIGKIGKRKHRAAMQVFVGQSDLKVEKPPRRFGALKKSLTKVSGRRRGRKIVIKGIREMEGSRIIEYMQIRVACKNPSQMYFSIARRPLVSLERPFWERLEYNPNATAFLQKLFDKETEFSFLKVWDNSHDSHLMLTTQVLEFDSKGLVHSDEEIAELEKRLEFTLELARRIDRLGGINTDAEEREPEDLIF